MGEPHRAVGCVYRLATWPASPEHVYAQIFLIDLDIDFLGLRQNGDRGCGGMNAPSCLGLRHALYAMHARLELQSGKYVAPDDRRARLFEPAKAGLRKVEELKSPAPQSRIPLVHAKKLGGKQRRLLPAGPGPDFENRIACVIGILRQQTQSQSL